MRSILLIAGVFLLAPLQGEGQLIKARNLLEQGDLLEAKSFANEAVKKEEHKDKARAWYYRGKIHYKLFRSNDEEHRKYVEENNKEVAEAAVSSYLKALELDQKGKFEKEINKELPVLKSALLNQGVKAFNKRDYEGALRAFDLGIRAGEKLNDGKPVDTLAYFNAGLAARQLRKNDKALDYFKTSIELGNQEAKSYFIASRIYKGKGEMDKAFEMVQKGREEHPEFRKLVLEELDHFIRRKKYDTARKRLEKALKGNPRNAPLHFSLGTVYDRLYQASAPDSAEGIGNKDSSLFQEAAQHYKKAIELDSGFHSAYYSLGALYYNRGADVLNASNTLKGQAKYEDEIKKAKEDLRRAQPFLERAVEIKPDDKQTLISLRNLYSRMGKKEKVEEIQKRLKKN